MHERLGRVATDPRDGRFCDKQRGKRKSISVTMYNDEYLLLLMLGRSSPSKGFSVLMEHLSNNSEYQQWIKEFLS